MNRVFNLPSWRRVGPDMPLPFVEGDPRRIRMTINPVDDCRIYLVSDRDGVAYFLGRFTAFGELEFDLDFTAHLECSADCWVHCHDGVFHQPESIGETFTEVAVRRERSPEVMQMEAFVLYNRRRLEAAMVSEVERIEQHYRSLAGAAPAVTSAPETVGAGVAESPVTSGDGA